ncbi:MAG TPA: zinc-finger domain-containing protein [Candidatus Enterocloster faecavium]|uniref:Zinc-finger domain-containing protein n=1 Tax=Candidatus Enterocloster faecavium TaxID=2838560 RepID=A0A9D2L9J6_9FIRM|nr:zinc-finger domain-containing protein [Candidatus Enterocloster faecavium]
MWINLGRSGREKCGYCGNSQNRT